MGFGYLQSEGFELSFGSKIARVSIARMNGQREVRGRKEPVLRRISNTDLRF